MFGRLVAAITTLVVVVGCSAPAPPTQTPMLTQAAIATPAPSAALAVMPSVGPTSSAGEASTLSPVPSPAATVSGTTTVPAGYALDGGVIGRHLDALMQIASDNGGIRAAGTAGYTASADYVAGQLTQMGYAVEREPFDFTFFDEAAPVELTVGDQHWTGPEWLHSFIYAPSGDVTAAVQSVKLTSEGRVFGTGGCDLADWADFVPGSIALVETGPCPRHDQIFNAQRAGAVGLISLYPGWDIGQTRRPTLGDPAGITLPAIVAGAEPTTALLAAAAAGGSAHFVSSVTMSPATNDNIIAERAGSSDQVVMLGSHLDSVLDGPGINDNGSGVATLLSLAQSVATNPMPDKTVRFGLWGAEELGELGSRAYVESLSTDDLARISAYLNLDMVASPNAARFVYDDATAPPGSEALTQMLLDELAAAGSPGLITDLGGASDHRNFELAGVPSAGVFSGLAPLSAADVAVFGGEQGVPADACYHLSCDTRANINMDSALTLGGAATAVLAKLVFTP